jgi:sugar transferase (PEP-CTERM/EpsH1 system associated)
MNARRALIVHIVHRLDYGGLENGLVNLINGLPESGPRHAIVCMAGYSDFSQRITREQVAIYSLDKKPGQDPGAYLRLWALLRKLRPQVVHTRNPGVMDCAIVAFLAGVPVRIHGMHGWDIDDLHGNIFKKRMIRRICRPFISRYVAVSAHIRQWLVDSTGIPADRVHRIYNGVDTRRFSPPSDRGNGLRGVAASNTPVTIGTIGRLEPVKDQTTLARAFTTLMKRRPDLRTRARLKIVGGGSLQVAIEAVLRDGECLESAALTGYRDDVPEQLRAMDIFVLPSLNEGISNTILEAMATGLPVVASAVGGNVELVADGVNGRLVPPADPVRLAEALEAYLDQPELIASHGNEARRRAQSLFALDTMVQEYGRLYADVLNN